jgi:hypothetical protein
VSFADTLRAFVRSALLDNLGLKIVSLVCALGFYAFIHGAENAQRTFRVSVVSIMPPDDANRRLMTPLPTEIAVTLRGSRSALDDLRADDLGSLQLDLRSGQRTRIDLDPSMIHALPGLAVEEMYPARVDLRWDDVVTRVIRVQIARTGEPAPGFMVKGAPRVEPESITAQGPRSVIDVIAVRPRRPVRRDRAHRGRAPPAAAPGQAAGPRGLRSRERLGHGGDLAAARDQAISRPQGRGHRLAARGDHAPHGERHRARNPRGHRRADRRDGDRAGRAEGRRQRFARALAARSSTCWWRSRV